MRGMIVLFLLAGCTGGTAAGPEDAGAVAKAGTACSQPGAEVCPDDNHAVELVCQGGAWTRFPCSAGCSGAAPYVVCDRSQEGYGDACPTKAEGETHCTTDVIKSGYFTCRSGFYQQTTCADTADGGTTACGQDPMTGAVGCR